MENFDVYKDIQARCGGCMYLGIVGPVRTGKSTFIKRFMELMVLSNMEDGPMKERTKDELPQSASGTTIMTAEPKFVPKEPAEVCISDGIQVKVRLADCVGYMVDGASGHMEHGEERKVKTPWLEEEIPFTKAATIGTQKVIQEHATIGIVITTDGTIGELKRGNYISAEERTIKELQQLGKPFLVVVNSKRPYSQEAKQVVNEIKERYQVSCMAVNCEQLREEDIHSIMEQILYEFPIVETLFYIPKWIEMLGREHPYKQEMLKRVKEIMGEMHEIKDAINTILLPKSDLIKGIRISNIDMDCGRVTIEMDVFETYYYQMLSELAGVEIESEYALVQMVKELSQMRQEYEEVREALEGVKQKGYGVVKPKKEEIHVDDPIVIRQGNKYGVKIRSEAPSIHMIRANIETEIAPIVGSEKQAEDLISYIRENAKSEKGIWGTNIFGKSMEEMLLDGMRSKIHMIDEDSQMKLQDTMQKIVNDSNGGMVCIII